MQQVYALISRINYAPLSMEIFHYPEDAINAARTKVYDLCPSLDFPQEIFGEEASALMRKARALNFDKVIYAALWGGTENIVLVATFDVQGGLNALVGERS